MRERKKKTSASFRDALAAFEAGLDDCGAKLAEARREFEDALSEDLASHEATYGWIRENSPELNIRCSELEARDVELRLGLPEVMASQTEALATLRAYCQRCREHEAAVLEWFLESVYRDTGAVD